MGKLAFLVCPSLDQDHVQNMTSDSKVERKAFFATKNDGSLPKFDDNICIMESHREPK